MPRTWIAVLVALGCRSNPPATPAPGGYLKGQLHVHSSNSGDSETPPDEVARWYRDRGFDFIVITDHNRITTLPDLRGLLVIPGVELTQNLETCEPPPAPGLGCLLHVNALFVTETSPAAIRWVPPPDAPRRLDLYTAALEQTRRLGGLAQLNHPNFHWGADAALVGELARRGLALFEVANQSSDVANEGDADHPSTEAMWDAVLTDGGMLYGVASDDAHHYADADAVRARGIIPDTGDRGRVMVHAPRDPEAIRDALTRGDFYSSTGVVLERIEHTPDGLVIEGGGADHEFALIGAGGRVLATSRGRAATFALGGARGGYVRATVTDAAGHRAWVQPFRVP